MRAVSRCVRLVRHWPARRRRRSQADASQAVELGAHVRKGEKGSAQYTAPASPRLDVSARIARVECFFGATGATLAHGGNRAFKADNGAIFAAASHAQRAADFINDLQPAPGASS